MSYTFFISSANSFVSLEQDFDVTFDTAPVEESIRSFAYLAEGWDYGLGGPIDQKTIDRALVWLKALSDRVLPATGAFPGNAGEICISFSRGPHYLEIIVEPDNTVSVAYDYERRQVFYRLHLSNAEAVESILEAEGRIWNAYISYTPGSITQKTISGRGQPLEIIRDHSLLSAVNVWQRQDRPFVNISDNTMVILQGSPAIHQSTGVSIPVISRRAAGLNSMEIETRATMS